MENLTGIRALSCLDQCVNPRRNKSGRKERKHQRRPSPNILNRAVLTRSGERHRLRFNHSHNIDRPSGLIEVGNEIRWLAEHGHEYSGQWVALDGGRLIANGENAREVYELARTAGVNSPMVVRVEPREQLPFGGW